MAERGRLRNRITIHELRECHIDAAHDLASAIQGIPAERGSGVDQKQIERFAAALSRHTSHAARRGSYVGMKIDLPQFTDSRDAIVALVEDTALPGTAIVFEPTSPESSVGFLPTRIIGARVKSSYKPQSK